METCTEKMQAASTITLGRSHDWVRHVISLLDTALHHLDSEEKTAQGTILKAASLLRQQIDPPPARIVPDERGYLLAWQVRKVRDYIDSHIAGPVLVADLCALFKRSEAYFSRSFKRALGESPHAFLVRRRVELAAQYMLTTDAPLSDIALRCGFTDQAHLCKHFRQAAGQTPAAWRRAQQHDERETPLVERFSTASRSGKRAAAGRAIDRATQGLPPALQLARD
jgi:AraC family transcriptional regulator